MLNTKAIKRVVVKVGTSTLTHDNGRLNLRTIDHLARVISECQNRGYEMVLVTSAAISIGAQKLGMEERPTELRFKQAAAAVGQGELMHLYNKCFAEYGHNVAQILLTHEDIIHVSRRRNLINTFDALFISGAIPIINENDTVSVKEIEFNDENTNSIVLGDNDTLSAVVAKLCMADLLILLTDIEGLYDSDPRQNPQAQLVPVVYEITDQLRRAAGGAGTRHGTGGMSTKLSAAQICMEDHIPMHIASGKNPEIVFDILEGKPAGTLFLPPQPGEEEIY